MRDAGDPERQCRKSVKFGHCEQDLSDFSASVVYFLTRPNYDA